MASAVDSRLAYARLSAVATASRLPTANRGSNNSYTTSWDTTHVFVEDVTVAGIQEVRSTYRTTDLSRKLGRYHDDVDAVFWAWNDICLDPAFRSWNIEEYFARHPLPRLANPRPGRSIRHPRTARRHRLRPIRARRDRPSRRLRPQPTPRTAARNDRGNFDVRYPPSRQRRPSRGPMSSTTIAILGIAAWSAIGLHILPAKTPRPAAGTMP